MSLINDALKKAQRQRTEGNTPAADAATPGPSAEPLQRVARREKPAGFRTQLILIGSGAAVIVVLLAIGAVFFFRSPDKAVETPRSAQTAATSTPNQTKPATSAAPAPVTPAMPASVVAPAPTVTQPASNPASVASAEPTSAQAASLSRPTSTQIPPTTSTPAPTPAPAGQFVLQTPPPTVSTSEVAPTPAPSAPAIVERPKPSTRMIGVIEHYRVGGIRVSGTESKVLMNDKVYRLNDIVDFELGIRLTGIEPKALTFEDTRGAVHTRNF